MLTQLVSLSLSLQYFRKRIPWLHLKKKEKEKQIK